MASVRLRDRDLTAELRSLKLKARMRSPSRKLARVAGIRCGTGELLDAAEAAGFDVFLTT